MNLLVILVALIICFTLCSPSPSLAQQQHVVVLRSAVRSVIIGTPSIVSVNLTLSEKKKNADEPTTETQQQQQQRLNCDLLARISGIKPGKVYEARVSFAGSPPVQHDLEIVTLKQLVEPSPASSDSPSSQHRNNNPRPGSTGGAKRRAKKNLMQSRRLLDTERVQFRSGAQQRKADQQPQFGGALPKLDRGVEQQLLAEEEGDRVEVVEDFIERFSEPAAAAAGDKKKVQVSFVIDREPDSSSSVTALCLRVHSWGVPSLDFVVKYPRSEPMNVRFVVTVDEMLFGALPVSAIPSVVMAVFFVCFGLLAVLPRVVKVL